MLLLSSGLRVGRGPIAGRQAVSARVAVAGAAGVQARLGDALRGRLVDVIVLAPPAKASTTDCSSKVGDAEVCITAPPFVEDPQEQDARDGSEQQQNNGHAGTKCER